MEKKFLSDNHWLFWPSIFFALQVVIYPFIFSSKGYLAYQELSQTKKKLKAEVEQLQATKESLKYKRDRLKDDKKVYKKFQEELLLYKDRKVEIIKFEAADEDVFSSEITASSLQKWQRIYIISGSLLQIILVGLFWRLKKSA